MSVMTRIFGMPTFSLSLDIALNLSTIARTLPGLQYMISRTRYMGSLRVRGPWEPQQRAWSLETSGRSGQADVVRRHERNDFDSRCTKSVDSARDRWMAYELIDWRNTLCCKGLLTYRSAEMC